jgi:putative transposase
MGRPLRAAQGGLVYHTLNRANARLTIFEDEGDYTTFERILAEAVTRYGMRLLAYCLMPNDFHSCSGLAAIVASPNSCSG